MLPADDVAIAIDDTLLRDLIAAQLPFELDVKGFHAQPDRGRGAVPRQPDRDAARVGLPQGAAQRSPPPSASIGALEDIKIDPATGTLGAKIAVDHIGIEKAAGLEAVLSGATLDEAGTLPAQAARDQLPPVQIPVKVQQAVELPAVTNGPVKIVGASMPLEVAVSSVFAGQGRLWIGVSVRPGVFEKTATARAARSACRGAVSLGARHGASRGSRREPRGEALSSSLVADRERPCAARRAGGRPAGAEGVRPKGPRDPRRSSAPRSRRSRRSATFCGPGSTS